LHEPLLQRGLFVLYDATHAELERRAWVVTTAPSLASRADLTKILLDRAALLGKLGGETTLALYEVVRDGERCGLALEAPTGPTLAGLSAALSATGGLQPEEVVAVGVLICRAVAVMHAAGVAHLALSPADVHFTRTGAIKIAGLLDVAPFGAQLDEKDIPEPGAEASYRAPERIAGDAPKPQSDVFSIAVIVHELAAGAHPFLGDGDAGAARRIRTAPPPALPTRAVDGLEHVLVRALEKLPALRHDNAARFGDDLATLLDPQLSAEQLARSALARGGFDADEAPGGAAPAPALRPLVAQLGAIGALMVVVAAALGGAGGPPQPLGLATGARAAYVRVLAHPWAEVSIDGEVIDVTPIGKPIPVAPGKHEVLLRHPRAPDERRPIEVEAGETVVVDVEMAVERKIETPVDPSP
jgi:serine/threonine-protein kinase